jgi:sugar lactone lactonase YvrE
MQAELLFDAHALLGEGAVWDDREGVLLWVDIDGQKLHKLRPNGADEEMPIGEKIGCVMARKGAGVILGVKRGVALMDQWRGPIRLVASPEKEKPDNRMNHGTCDSAGRFWVGTMSPPSGHAALFRYDPDGSIHTMLSGVTISNGIGFSVDDRVMYYIDTPTHRVDAFTYDAASGAIRDRRLLVQVPQELGDPDGMTMDEEGCLWVAHWNGHAVRRYTPAGLLDRTILVPAARVTSCAFGGRDRSDLYITTASVGQSEEEKAKEPHAGGVFVVRPGVRGLPAFVFGG